MPIEVGWFVPDHINFIRVRGEYDDAMIIAAGQYAAQIAESSSEPYVHLLFDISGSLHYPSPSTIRHVKPPENTGWVIGYGATHPMQRFVANIVLNALGVELILTNTYDDALQRLVRFAPTIADKLDSASFTVLRQF